MPVNDGYEVQIDNHPERGKNSEDDTHSTGMLYSLTKPLAKAWKPGPEWNTMEITLDVSSHNKPRISDFSHRHGGPSSVRSPAMRHSARAWIDVCTTESS